MTNDKLALVNSKRPIRPKRVKDVSEQAPHEESLLNRMEADPRASLELAAATLTARLQTLLSAAVHARGDRNQRYLADRLRVSEGRVSQVLSGEDNLRVTTVARYLRALGYELEVSAKAVEEDAPVLQSIWRRYLSHGMPASHVYMSYVTDGYVTAPKFSIIPGTMSDTHRAVTSTVFLGELEADSKLEIHELESTKHLTNSGREPVQWIAV